MVYDFFIGHHMQNTFFNPDRYMKEFWDAEFTKLSPRVQKYVKDFAEDQKDYIANRPACPK